MSEPTKQEIEQAIDEIDCALGALPLPEEAVTFHDAQEALCVLRVAFDSPTVEPQETECKDVHPFAPFGEGRSGNFQCEREQGHGGDHERYSPTGKPTTRWPITTSTQEPASHVEPQEREPDAHGARWAYLVGLAAGYRRSDNPQKAEFGRRLLSVMDGTAKKFPLAALRDPGGTDG